MDNHIRPQVDFLLPDTDVFRIEDGIASALETAAGHLDLTLTETNTHTNRRDYREPVTWYPETRTRAIAFYQADFERFGYDPEQSFDDLTLAHPQKRWWSLR